MSISERASPVNAVLWLLLALCIARLWLMPLPSSFWVDEMGTVFVVHHGAADPSLRAAPQVADSIYYLLPKIAEKIGGFSEIGYRFFSVLAMAGALLAISALASRLIGRGAGWFVAFACLASRNFDYQAADARPYALGTLVLSLALLELVRWFDAGSWRDALLFALCASLLWWVHLAFWPFYLIFPVYGIFRIRRKDHHAGARQIGIVAAIVVLACIPPLMRSLTLLHGAGAHVVAPAPSLLELSSVLKLGMVLGACALGFILSRWFRWSGAAIPASAFVLILAWWLIDPVVIFGVSNLTRNSLFLARYMYPAIPGAALAACLFAGLFIPAKVWKPVAAVLGVAALIFTGHWKQVWPDHQSSDWRAASAILREWSGGERIPVISPSPFIEARPPVWTPDYPLSGFLYSNLAVYPMAGHVYPFPFESSPEAVSFARELTGGTLAHGRRFALYGGDKAVKFWRGWFTSQPELARWNSKVLAYYGDVELVAFTNPD